MWCTIFWQFNGYSALRNHENGVGGIFAASNCFWPLGINADEPLSPMTLKFGSTAPTDQGVDSLVSQIEEWKSAQKSSKRYLSRKISTVDSKYGKNMEKKNWKVSFHRKHERTSSICFHDSHRNVMVYAWSIKYDSEIRPPTRLFQSFAIHWPLARLLPIAAEVKHNRTSILTLFLHSFHFSL